ncbi:hypothetical protein CLU79DRAFT_764171 [Phycomyces nitens]|nr:hypothetical protein CLU79DRAFT_764171 [Phycomyces nitens]
MNHICLLSLGSRGDLQPFIVLAAHHRKQWPDDRITIVCFKDILQKFSSVLRQFKIATHPLPSSTYIIDTTAKEIARERERNAIREACLLLKPTLIIFSTFTIEGWSISEHLQIPCIGISLFPLDIFPMPSEFKNELCDSLPELTDALSRSNKATVDWRHVEHWMWRLFLEDQGDFRERLGLTAMPFVNIADNGTVEVCLPSPTTIIYAFDPLDNVPDTSVLGGFWVDPDIFRDASEDLWKRSPEFILDIKRFIHSKDSMVIIHFGSMEQLYPGFRDKKWLERLVDLIRRTLEQLQLAAIWWMTPDSPLHKACLKNFSSSTHKMIYICLESIPHDFIVPAIRYGFPTVDFDTWWINVHKNKVDIPCQRNISILHHGGAGTFGSMAAYGIPQLILPCMFDQFFWATRGESHGISKTMDINQDWSKAFSWSMEDIKSCKNYQKITRDSTTKGLLRTMEIVLNKKSY